MVNGKPGDDPILDLTVHGLPAYSDTIDALIREVWPLCGARERDELRAMLPPPKARNRRRPTPARFVASPSNPKTSSGVTRWSTAPKWKRLRSSSNYTSIWTVAKAA